VNCFQKLLSSWHDTTAIPETILKELLWIAFKNYYLRDTTQRRFRKRFLKNCCELLSKIIIFVTRHNFAWIIPLGTLVVNCFQKLLSSWHDTTQFWNYISIGLLWIAFKNYYLRDTTQPLKMNFGETLCCELLSKIIIFVTRHNLDLKNKNKH